MSREPGEAEKRLQAAQKLAGGATERLQLEYLLLRATTGDTDEPAVALGTYLANDDPESVAILETLAAAYIRDLRYGPAYSTLERWIGMDPENATPLFWRGWVLERLNQAKSAMGDYRKALELDPELFNARLRVAEMLLEDKQPEEARK
jgi:Flp pilus assembly protein TadD